MVRPMPVRNGAQRPTRDGRGTAPAVAGHGQADPQRAGRSKAALACASSRRAATFRWPFPSSSYFSAVSPACSRSSSPDQPGRRRRADGSTDQPARCRRTGGSSGSGAQPAHRRDRRQVKEERRGQQVSTTRAPVEAPAAWHDPVLSVGLQPARPEARRTIGMVPSAQYILTLPDDDPGACRLIFGFHRRNVRCRVGDEGGEGRVAGCRRGPEEAIFVSGQQPGHADGVLPMSELCSPHSVKASTKPVFRREFVWAAS